ncbi:MAG: hypothetical protein DRJ03_01340 [Chloroflexi bacterium]|nr:MAG: hypothetical protein DRJ03_01340 [Chloroflexota bacterium]
MARKTETFKIEGYDKSFTVTELTVKQIIGLVQDDVQTAGDDFDALRSIFADKVLPLASNVTMEDLVEMAPSDIKEFWDHFYKVNSVFFEMARKSGLKAVLETLQTAILSDFGKWLAGSLRPDIKTS